MAIEFLGIPNLSAVETTPCRPWEFTPRVPRFATKKLYKEWLARETTDHLLYSGFVGLIPGLRIEKSSNPIHSMTALVADFDSLISENDLATMLERAGTAAPTWAHTTPSGGARLIWELDRPVLITSPAVLQKMLRAAAKSMALKSLLPGFDFQDAFLNPSIYYDVGRDWMEVDGASPLSHNLVEGWILSVSDSVPWSGEEIPLEVIQAEMERRFPGRWTGPFEVGSRGVRFWDPQADNETAAIIRESGVQCFTGPSGWMPWAKIFGAQFVDQFQEKKLGHTVEGIYRDDSSYWYQSADGTWESRGEREMQRWLKVERDLSGEKSKDATYSEVEHALHVVDQHRRILGAAPFIYTPPGLIDFMGRRVINTSRTFPIAPHDSYPDWGDNFPWLAEFIENFFDTEEQVHYFLAWLSRFYRSAHEQNLLQGQALFIAGDPGQGKTLLSNLIISRLMGGHQDAAPFLLGDTSFNKGLFHVGLWTIDDATPGDNASDHKKFSSLLKKVTANTTFEYHAKFKDAMMVEWSGRVIITGNLDAESLRILPDCDTSILDKIMLLRARRSDKKFPRKDEIRAIVARELPYLAAYLAEMEPHPEVVGDMRYGIKSFHHEELRASAGESTDAHMFDEILQTFLLERVRNKEPVPWRGSCTELMRELLLDDVLRSMIGRQSTRWVGIQLGKLEGQDRGVTSHRSNGKKIYVVDLRRIGEISVDEK